jgi:hypothetical protein
VRIVISPEEAQKAQRLPASILFHTVFPVARVAVHVHDGYDVDAFGFLRVDDGVGKCGGEVALTGAVKMPEKRRGTLNLGDQASHFLVEALAKLGIYRRIVRGSLIVFVEGLGMDFLWFHSPTVL